MKKIFILMVFCILSLVSFTQEIKGISTIDTFRFEVREVSTINNRRRVREYTVAAELPDSIRKEMTFPEGNKGEVYIYKGDRKIVYLPLLGIYSEEEIDEEENYIIRVLKDIKAKEESDPSFKEDFYNGEVAGITYENGLKITFDKLERVSGYHFPVKISVYDGRELISELVLKNIEINIPIGKEEFEI